MERKPRRRFSDLAMPRLPRVLGLVFATALPAARAAEPVPSILARPPSPPPIESPAPPRAISATTAARLAAASPKFSPLPPAPPAAAASDVDTRADRPRNRIIRLPDYVVTEPKIRVPPRERHLLTPEGKLALALKRHPGLRLGNIGPLKNTFWANALLDEDFAAERTAEAASLFGLLPGGPRRPMIFRAPPEVVPAHSGPWGGLLVPWERR